MAKAYNAVLDNAAGYDYGAPDWNFPSDYAYTLVTVDGEEYPVLLVSKDNNPPDDKQYGMGIKFVKAFTHNKATGSADMLDGSIKVGRAHGGGGNVKLYITKENPHLESINQLSGMGDFTISAFSLKDGTVGENTVLEGNYSQHPQDQLVEDRGYTEVTFIDDGDRSVLTQYQGQ